MTARVEVMEIPCRSWRLGTGDRQIILVWQQLRLTALRKGEAVASYEIPREFPDVRGAANFVLLAIRAKCPSESDFDEVNRAIRSWTLRILGPETGGRER